jgi:allose kinase
MGKERLMLLEGAIIGIDLGGTNLRIGTVDEENRVHSFRRRDSERIAQAKDPMVELNRTIEEYIKESGIADVKAISIGVPSSVANDKKTVICTTNIRNAFDEPVFKNRNIAKDIEAWFHVPVFVNHDTNNILLYDMMSHHLPEDSVVVGIYIGTGVGAAVCIGGRMLEGKDGAAMDVGHIPFYNGKALCSCGKKGCCECYASGWRLQEIRRDYFPETPIKELFIKHGNTRPIREFIYSCAQIFAIMATIFNPEAMIAGGGVMEMEGFPRKQFERAVNENTGRDVMSYGFQYLYSEDIDSKGVVGAALFARKMMK